MGGVLPARVGGEPTLMPSVRTRPAREDGAALALPVVRPTEGGAVRRARVASSRTTETSTRAAMPQYPYVPVSAAR